LAKIRWRYIQLTEQTDKYKHRNRPWLGFDMGYVRFLLAALVVVEHAGAVGDLAFFHNIGALASVEAFFLISGFYMAASYTRNYSGPTAFYDFMMSRFIRLYPLYITVLVLTFLATLALPMLGRAFGSTQSALYWLEETPWWHHLGVWTLQIQDLISIDQTGNTLLPIPQAWSISAEFLFYALTPVFIRYRLWLPLMVAAAFALKYWLLQHFGWRWSYFPAFSQVGYFLLGMCAYYLRRNLTFTKPVAYLALAAATGTCLFLPAASFEASLSRNALLTLVFFLATPIMFAHLNSKASNKLGDMSYGIYISQYLMMELVLPFGLRDWFVQRFSAELGTQLFAVAVLAITTILAFCFEETVQKAVDKARHRLFHAPPRRGAVDDRSPWEDLPQKSVLFLRDAIKPEPCILLNPPASEGWRQFDALRKVRLVDGAMANGPLMRRWENGRMVYREMTPSETADYLGSIAW
jgi:peptidoglycan/LPS O-acetylase OafA/YrhL